MTDDTVYTVRSHGRGRVIGYMHWDGDGLAYVIHGSDPDGQAVWHLTPHRAAVDAARAIFGPAATLHEEI